MIKAIIFDFFGVICPDLYWGWLRKQIPNLENQRDYFQKLSDQFDLGKLSTTQLIKILSDKTSVEENKVIPFIEQSVQIDTEVAELIKSLKRNYKIGLLSNSNSEFIEGILKEHDLNDLFDSVVISQKVGFIKPQKEIFEIALKELNVASSEVLFVDDRESNTSAGEKLGIKGLVYKDAVGLREELKRQGILLT